MSTITLKPEVQETAEMIATMTGKPIPQLIEEALNQQLRKLNRQKIDTEMEAYIKLHPTLKTTYFGQYIAIHEGKIVATEDSFESIVVKIRHQYGRMAVLIRKVEETPQRTLNFYSTRG